MRETKDTIEKKGIATIKKRLKSVAFKIFLINRETDLNNMGIKIFDEDLVFKAKADRGNKTRFSGISGKTGLGVKEAISLIEKKLPKFYFNSGSISTYRQQSKISDLLDVFLGLELDIKGGLDVELVAEKARYGLKLIEQLTGRIDTEEVLGIIFKSFCRGK